MNALLHIWNIAAAAGLFVLLRRRFTHITDKRIPNVLAAFIVAGFVSIVLSSIFYGIYPEGLGRALSRWEIAYNIAVVGLVEESAKFLAFLFAVKAGSTFREPQDGVISAAAVGITFGAVENIGYIQHFDAFFIALRPILTTAGHGVYAAIWGALYSQAVYANSMGRDPGATRNALLGVPLVAVIHGIYNAATFFYPLALFVDAIALMIALALFHKTVELSPYRIYPLSQAKRAVRSIRHGLRFNPKSPILNRNIGIYLMHLGKYRAASGHLRASVPRSKDPRRAQFLAAACELTFLPRFFAHRVLRIAWSRLGDEQRIAFMDQLQRLAGEPDGVADRVRAFTDSAFKPRRYRNTRDIAREAKLRRLDRRRPRPSDGLRQAASDLDDEERARMRRSLGKG